MAASGILALQSICALFFVFAFFIPPDGVDALVCLKCKEDSGSTTNCAKPDPTPRNCTIEKGQCFTKTVDGKVIHRGCENPGNKKLGTDGCIEMVGEKATNSTPENPDTAGSEGKKVKFCFCKTDKCEPGGAATGLAGYFCGWPLGHILVISFLLVIITPRFSDE